MSGGYVMQRREGDKDIIITRFLHQLDESLRLFFKEVDQKKFLTTEKHVTDIISAIDYLNLFNVDKIDIYRNLKLLGNDGDENLRFFYGVSREGCNLPLELKYVFEKIGIIKVS
ncbi:MAG: hypothetical protein GKR92_05410 [Gammaproteobacteria bacterium]|nr:MAG: hypothetical protein GKR92_05410 [Gammaproteobacteria bacterium]